MKRAHALALAAVMLVAAGCAVATLLPDGRVMFMNGIVKIYNPASGQLLNATTPTPARAWHTATLLQDGKVLLAGGITGNQSLTGGATGSPAPGSSPATSVTNSASIYDPATDTYSQTGAMSQGRITHTATLLADGRVLVAGGSSISLDLTPTSGSENTTPPLASAEIYDPNTGTFSATGNLVAGRSLHTATLLPDGKVLIAGGVDADNNSLKSAELFDPATGTFTATGSLNSARSFHTATALADGTVLLVGGASSGTGGSSSAGGVDPASQSAEIYDPQSGTFTAVTSPLIAPRLLHTATLLDDGKVLIAGGIDTGGQGAMLASAELFDPATGTFSKTGDMLTGHAFAAAEKLADGKVIIAGFSGSLTDMVSGPGTPSSSPKPNTDPLASAEIYDPNTGTWSAVQVEPAPSFALPSGLGGSPLLPPAETESPAP